MNIFGRAMSHLYKPASFAAIVGLARTAWRLWPSRR